MKTLIIIPAFNEEENIEKVVENIIVNFPQYDYVVINDGSTDKTEEICRKKNYALLNLPINLGIGGAVQAGYRYAKKNDYDIAIQIDGDGQHDIFFAQNMVQLIENDEVDIVIGSRFLEKKGFQSSGTRRIGIRILSNLIKLCTSVRVNDVTSGFRAVNKKFIQIYSNDYSNDYPEPEAIVSAVMYGGRIKEIPVVMNERQGGESSIKFWNSIYYMIKVTLAILIRRISYGLSGSKGK
ncbi:MAG: glycosyltransferase family 2 protein, partial [Clostridiales bacterium]|nr:glycosyltransferase family 2 protein [Clostridiales bacterium]